jgi:gas vesicle protein
MARNDNGGSFVLGFLVGGIVGAAVGLLLAPRSGQDTRAELAGRSEAWRNRAEEMAANLRERAGTGVDTARERINPTIDSARERINPAVEGVRDRVSPIVEQVNTRLGRTNSEEPNPADAAPDATSKNGGLDQTTDERA